jgi:hypothetical protein
MPAFAAIPAIAPDVSSKGCTVYSGPWKNQLDRAASLVQHEVPGSCGTLGQARRNLADIVLPRKPWSYSWRGEWVASLVTDDEIFLSS